MSTQDKSPARATNTDQAPNNEQAVQTTHTTRKPLIFHTILREDDEAFYTLCGFTVPKQHSVRPKSKEQRDRQQCHHCRDMAKLAADLDRERDRRQRAEQVTEYILRVLDEKEGQ